MTEPELQQLRALNEEIAKADHSPWEPRCVARAFRREPLVVAGITLHPLTLSGYLRLSEIRSPLISGRWPDHTDEILEAVAGALSVFSGSHRTVDGLVESFSQEQVTELREGLKAMTHRAFSTVLRMEFGQPDGASPASRRGGFGMWLPLYAWLRRTGLSRAEALETPLDEIFAMLAATKFSNGADVFGETYLQMDSDLSDTAPSVQA